MTTSDGYLLSNTQALVWIARKSTKTGGYQYLQVRADNAERNGFDFYFIKANCEKETKKLSKL